MSQLERFKLHERLERETRERVARIRAAGEPSPFMSRSEVAEHFRVNETTVRRNRGHFAEIRRTKISTGKFLYLRADVEAVSRKLELSAYAPADHKRTRDRATKRIA